jgi:dihydroorotate dehydrogenase
MYKVLVRPVLFLVDPEKIHHFVFSFLKWSAKIPVSNLCFASVLP